MQRLRGLKLVSVNSHHWNSPALAFINHDIDTKTLRRTLADDDVQHPGTQGLTSPMAESIDGLETNIWDGLEPVVCAYVTNDHEQERAMIRVSLVGENGGCCSDHNNTKSDVIRRRLDSERESRSMPIV